MSQISRKLGFNVRRTRLKKGFTQKELCRKLKVDVSYFSNLENGRKNPTLATMDKIARIRQIAPNLDYILTDMPFDEIGRLQARELD